MRYTKENLNLLPKQPGIYKMLSSQDEVLYVGKARVLQSRVKQYFTQSHIDVKTRLLVSHIHAIDIVVTHHEKEALLLERQLIKSLQPKYNIKLKDDKSFPYIKLTAHPFFPRLIITRTKQNDKARYYGPFPFLGSHKQLLQTLSNLFPIRSCKQHITLNTLQPSCILLDIGKCIGPCIKKSCRPQHDQLVDQLDQFLRGKRHHVITELEQKMWQYAQQQAYEQAAHIRDALAQLHRLFINTNDTATPLLTGQFWSYFQDNTAHYILLQTLQNGHLTQHQGIYDFDIAPAATDGFIEQVFLTHYTPDLPLYCSDNLTAPLAPLVQSLAHTQGLQTPKRGPKFAVIQRGALNAKIALHKCYLHLKQESSKNDSLSALQHHCNLQSFPQVIIGFDISHFQSSDIVAAAVVFINGSPAKKYYRTFHIRSVQHRSNDPLSMYEAVSRMLNHCKKQALPQPNLLLIDGGRAQLNYALTALAQLQLEDPIDCLSLAKKKEAIYLPHHSTPLVFSQHLAFMHLLQYVRNEAHRVACGFQRTIRLKKAKKSAMQAIPGLGDKKIACLYQHVASIQELATLSEEALQRIPTIGPALAATIYRFFRQDTAN